MAKRYLLFTCHNPACGGWEDFSASFSDLPTAIGAGQEAMDCSEWWHVVDLETGTIVANGERE